MNEQYIRAEYIAADMLGTLVEELPSSLTYLLRRANQLAQKTGGEIVSRQVVASILVMHGVT